MKQNDSMYIIDELAEQAGGYFAMPFQDSTLEFAELQSSNDFITWRPITGNALYVWDITTNKVLDLSENVSGLIDYVLYPFDEDYLVWCETNTQTQETKYPCIKISSSS